MSAPEKRRENINVSVTDSKHTAKTLLMTARATVVSLSLLPLAALLSAAPAFDNSTFELTGTSGTLNGLTSTVTVATPLVGVQFNEATPGLRAGVQPLGASAGSTVLMLHMDLLTNLVPGTTSTFDSSPNGFDARLGCRGVACSSPTLAGASLSQVAFSSAAQFDLTAQGTTNFIRINDPGVNSALDLTASPFTLEAWFALQALPDAQTGSFIIAGKSADAGLGYYLGVSSANASGQSQPSLVGYLNGTKVFTSTVPFDGAHPASPEWVHAAMTFDGVLLRIYVNGVLTSSVTAGAASDTAFPFAVGSLLDASGNPLRRFRGLIDDVKLSNVAFSDDQVAASFDSGAMRWSADSADGSLGSGHWTYVVDPSSVSLDGETFSGPGSQSIVHARTRAAGAQYVSCSNRNWAVFLVQDTTGTTVVSNPFNVRVTTVIPAVPVLNPAVVVSSTALSWSWDNAIPACTFSYAVSSATNGGAFVFVASQTANTFAQNGLTPNTSYQVQVLAANTTGQSLAMIASTFTAAAPPTGLTLTFVSSTSFALAWGANGNPAGTPFLLSYGPVGGATSTVLTASTFAFINSYSSNGLPISSATAHFFHVQAINAFGNLAPPVGGASASTITATSNAFQQGTFQPGQNALLVGLLGQRFVSLAVASNTFTQAYTLTIIDTGTAPCGPVTLGASTAAISVIMSPYQQPLQPVTLTVGFSAAEAVGATAGLLQLVRYDDATGTCVALPTAVDATARTLTARLNHLSIFQIVQAPAPPATVDAARVFPNPLYLSRGQGYVTLRNVPPGARWRVFTLRGELVFDAAADAAGTARWEGVNTSGFKVASGVYLGLIEYQGTKKIIKLAVER